MTSEQQPPHERLLERLRSLIECQPTSGAAISRKLENQDNWLARVFKGELGFDLNRAAQVLGVLDIPLAWFLDWCFEDYAEIEAHQILQALSPVPTMPGDPFLAEVRPPLLETLDKAEEQLDPHTMPDAVAEIDQLRFSDREAAKAAIESYLRQLTVQDHPTPTSAGEIATALAVWAAIQRTRDHLADAGEALALALEISHRFELSATMALLLQRSHYLLRDWGEPRQASRFIEMALVQFASLGRSEDVGRCLVDRGIIAHHLLDDTATISSCTASLKLLPDTGWRSRAVALQYIAEAHLRLGDTTQAGRAIDEALQVFEPVELDVCRGHAHWTRARVHVQSEELSEAAEHLHHALYHLTSGGGAPVDIALIALDLASILLRVGDVGGLRALAERVQAISPALRTSPIVDRVLMEFVRVARYGNVTALFLMASKEQLEPAAPPHGRPQVSTTQP